MPFAAPVAKQEAKGGIESPASAEEGARLPL